MRVNDPYGAYNYLLEINGLVSGGFSECTGLQMETKFFEYKEGGNNKTTLKFPEHTTYSNITLKRGITTSNDLIQWHLDIINGSFTVNPRQNVNNIAILLLNEKRTTVKRWNLTRAFPVKWSGPDLKATASEVAIESLEIAHEGIQLG